MAAENATAAHFTEMAASEATRTARHQRIWKPKIRQWGIIQRQIWHIGGECDSGMFGGDGHFRGSEDVTAAENAAPKMARRERARGALGGNDGVIRAFSHRNCALAL